jgi:hypothetical protein
MSDERSPISGGSTHLAAMLYATGYSAQYKTSGRNISVGSNTKTLGAPPDFHLSKVTAQRLLLVQQLDFVWTNELTSCEPN